MKRSTLYLMISLLVLSGSITSRVFAQAETPLTGSTGRITGTIINQNTGTAVTEALEVMLHILDQNYAEAGMLHAQSLADGTFLFADVPYESNYQFAAMAIYEDVTYSSATIPANMNDMQVALELPVYESTSDPAEVQIDQMHVLFDFAEDGLETKEIYVISSRDERTVKDVYLLEGDQSATLKFPLPADADYIFFKPDDPDRFIKFGGGFADTYPILPETRPTQFMVNYLVPYNGEREYSYTAPLNIAQIDFLVPEQANEISLQGPGLIQSESMTLQTGESYKVYSYYDLNAGQTLRVSLSSNDIAKSGQGKTALALGTAVLGLAIMGVGLWWWRKIDNSQNMENETGPNQSMLDGLILEIAKLDEQYEQGILSAEAYQQLRQDLMHKAKRLL